MGQWVRSAFEPKYNAHFQPNLWDNVCEVLLSRNIMLISCQEGHFLPGNGPKLALLALCEQEMSIVQ